MGPPCTQCSSNSSKKEDVGQAGRDSQPSAEMNTGQGWLGVSVGTSWVLKVLVNLIIELF